MDRQWIGRLTAPVVLATTLGAVVPTGGVHAASTGERPRPAPGMRLLAKPPAGWPTTATGRYASAAGAVLLRPVYARWWGTEIVLRSRTVKRISKTIAMGAGAAGVAAVLAAAGVVSSPGAIPAGAVSAVLTLGRAALEVCDWNNRGVRLLIPRLAPVATCWPR